MVSHSDVLVCFQTNPVKATWNEQKNRRPERLINSLRFVDGHLEACNGSAETVVPAKSAFSVISFETLIELKHIQIIQQLILNLIANLNKYISYC